MSKRFTVSEVFRKDMRSSPDHPYRRTRKYPANTECPECGLRFMQGIWKEARGKSRRQKNWKLCPACRQIRDDYPSGILRLEGRFVARHREEILNRIRNISRAVEAERPLERIMRIEERRDGITVYATGEHLVAHMGKALRGDFQGELEIKYAKEDKFASVRWCREE